MPRRNEEERKTCEEFIRLVDALVALHQLNRFDVIHINNGEHSGTQEQCKRANAKANRMGQRSGAADYLCFGRHFLEAKSAIGRLSDEQDRFRLWCAGRGLEYRIFRTARDGMDAVLTWQAAGILGGGDVPSRH